MIHKVGARASVFFCDLLLLGGILDYLLACTIIRQLHTFLKRLQRCIGNLMLNALFIMWHNKLCVLLTKLCEWFLSTRQFFCHSRHQKICLLLDGCASDVVAMGWWELMRLKRTSNTALFLDLFDYLFVVFHDRAVALKLHSSLIYLLLRLLNRCLLNTLQRFLDI